MNDFCVCYFGLDSVTATFCCCILVSEHANLFLGIQILSYAWSLSDAFMVPLFLPLNLVTINLTVLETFVLL